jgi:hypothetical protein
MPITPLTLALPGGKTAHLTLPAKADTWPDRLCVEIEGGASPFVEANWLWTSSASRQALERNANLSAGEVGVLLAGIKAWMPEAQSQLDADAEAAKTAQAPPAAAPVLEVVCREKKQSAAEGTTYAISSPDDLIALLRRATMPDNTVVEWSKASLKQCAVLDIDFHAGLHPSRIELLCMGDELSPAPRCWWISTGGGLKAVYWPLAGSPFTAEELAAGAAAQMATHPKVICNKGTVEIIPRTRHPSAMHNVKGGMKRCEELKTRTPDENFEILARLSSAGATDAEITEASDKLDLRIGERLSHDRCPIDPEHHSSSPNPVVVSEKGVYCHSCQGRTGDGFRSWGSIRKMNGLELSTVPAAQPLVDAAKHLVHYNHAYYLFEALLAEVSPLFRRTLYSALLKVHHGDDIRIPSAFSDFPFVRGAEGWLCAETLRLVKPLSRQGVACLPSAQFIAQTDDGPEAQPDPLKVEAYTNIGRLKGWTPLAGQPFVPIFFQHNTEEALHPTMGILRAVPRRVYSDRRVRYITPDKRLPLAECERRICEYLPGINLNYLKTLIILTGVGESGKGAVPVLWAKGETGAGKTVHINLVCSMYGEPVTSLSGLEEDKLAEGVAEAHEQSRLLTFDDPFKDPKKFAVLHRFWLQITNRQLPYHKLYVGSVNAQINGAIVIADRDDHGFFTNDKQFGRRCYRIHLRESVQDWQAMGRDAKAWWYSSPEMQEAAEGLHSHIVDTYFAAGDHRGIGEKLATFGVVRLDREDGYDASEVRERKWRVVTDLVQRIVADGGAALGDEIAKRVGVGFIEVKWSEQGGVSDLCTQLVESLGAVDLNAYNLQRVADDIRDWPFQTKDGMRVKLDVKALGKTRVFVRLAQDGLQGRNKARAINGACFTSPAVPMPLPTPAAHAAPTEPQRPQAFDPKPMAPAADAPRKPKHPPAQLPPGTDVFAFITQTLRGAGAIK